MDHEHKILGYYNYTVVLTYIGMLTGLRGIVYAFEYHLFYAVICLMFAGICDMFDGAIASTKERTQHEKSFGIQIDSLSDLICFGVLPATIVYHVNSHTNFVIMICGLYVLCALIRLAYFNVDEQERQMSSGSPRKYYKGMPVTLSAVFVPTAYILTQNVPEKSGFIGLLILIIMGILFLLPFQMKKLCLHKEVHAAHEEEVI